MTPLRGVCPSCDYAFHKHQDRLRWCNVFLAGLVAMGLAGVLMILGSHGALHGWFGWSVIVMGVGGIVATFVGMVGVLAGWPFVLTRYPPSRVANNNENTSTLNLL